jgi:hypothetical protein
MAALRNAAVAALGLAGFTAAAPLDRGGPPVALQGPSLPSISRSENDHGPGLGLEEIVRLGELYVQN